MKNMLDHRLICIVALSLMTACVVEKKTSDSGSPASPTTPSPPPPPPPPPAPVPPAVPTGLHVSESGPGFIKWTWNRVADATRYDIQISRNETFTGSDEIYQLRATTSRPSWHFRVSAGGRWHARVRAVAGTANTLLVSAWTTHVTGMTVVSDEHGNTRGTATAIDVPTRIQGELETPGDLDFFRFQLPSPGTLTIYSTGQTDTFGTLFEPSGRTTRDDNDGERLNFEIVASVRPGTHYVAVTGASASSTTGRYELHVSFQEDFSAFLFWTNASRGWKRIDIIIDGSPVGSLTKYWDEPPPADCTMPSAGRVIAERPPGTYLVEIHFDTGRMWAPQPFTLEAGQCRRVQIDCGEDRDCGTSGAAGLAESPD